MLKDIIKVDEEDVVQDVSDIMSNIMVTSQKENEQFIHTNCGDIIIFFKTIAEANALIIMSYIQKKDE